MRSGLSFTLIVLLALPVLASSCAVRDGTVGPDDSVRDLAVAAARATPRIAEVRATLRVVPAPSAGTMDGRVAAGDSLLDAPSAPRRSGGVNDQELPSDTLPSFIQP